MDRDKFLNALRGAYEVAATRFFTKKKEVDEIERARADLRDESDIAHRQAQAIANTLAAFHDSDAADEIWNRVRKSIIPEEDFDESDPFTE